VMGAVSANAVVLPAKMSSCCGLHVYPGISYMERARVWLPGLVLLFFDWRAGKHGVGESLGELCAL